MKKVLPALITPSIIAAPFLGGFAMVVTLDTPYCWLGVVAYVAGMAVIGAATFIGMSGVADIMVRVTMIRADRAVRKS